MDQNRDKRINKRQRILRSISSMLGVAVIVLAMILVGLKVFGLNSYVITSGSMEPTFPVGSLIYVKKVETDSLAEGDVITFMADRETVVTHRINEVVKEEDNILKFKTKGDANETIDGKVIDGRNVIGEPVLVIPGLGYVSNFVSRPPGMIFAFLIGIFLLASVFVSDDKIKKRKEEKRHDEKITIII